MENLISEIYNQTRKMARVLGHGKSVFRAGLKGCDEISDPVEFMETCYQYCTVYRKEEK